MNKPANSGQPRPVLDVAIGVLVATCVGGLFAGADLWITSGALALAFGLMWFQSTESGRLWYAATLGLPLPQSVIVSRTAIADVFMLPVITRELLAARRDGVGLPRSTMTWPFAFLLVVFAIGTWVGYERIGHLTSWAIFNKGAGVLFLIAVFAALTRSMRVREDAVRLARWFVAGVSLTNVPALLAVAASFAGYENPLYLVGNSRFYGWMQNPSVTGGLLLTAAMMELGMLASPAEPGQRRWARWTGLWLMGLSLALTLSRSTWTALGFAAAVLLALLVVDGVRTRQWRVAAVVSTLMFGLAPAAMMANIAAKNMAAGTMVDTSKRAIELREMLVQQCRTNPSLDICKVVLIPPGPAAERPAEPPANVSPVPLPAAPVATPAAGPDVSGALMNARGLNDRVAIVQSGWKDYNSSTRSRLLGIGLGSFYGGSAREFGVPLIIHNTFVWFLVEFGPLGLLVVLWIWIQTAWNLVHAAMRTDSDRYLTFGLLAAFAGFSVFCVFNEGFYQRQLWLIIAVADRLRMLPALPGASPPAEELA